MGDPGGRVELLEMVGPIKVHEVFLSALLLSQRPPSSRCWPVVPRPPRAIPGAPGRWGPSPAMALLGSLRGEGPFLLSMPPPPSLQTHVQSSHHLGTPQEGRDQHSVELIQDQS